tara:strand:+ start:385 stop:1134 length:750 start_codon:yes stop_codon:yes gene_type:complete
MNNNVQLVGDIGDKFGHEWSMNIESYSDIINLIDCQTEGFKKYLIESEENGIGFKIQRGEDLIQDEQELLLNINEEDIIITAVPLGAAETFKSESSSVFKIIIGAILVFLAWASGQSWAGDWLLGLSSDTIAIMATVGMNLINMGIMELNMPRTIGDEDGETNLFSGPVTGIKQGVSVPVAYGELLIGGSPINVAYTIQNINFTGVAPVQNSGRGRGSSNPGKRGFTGTHAAQSSREDQTVTGVWNQTH